YLHAFLYIIICHQLVRYETSLEARRKSAGTRKHRKGADQMIRLTKSHRQLAMMGASALAITALTATGAFAQTAQPASNDSAAPSSGIVKEVVVTGQRASLRSAQQIKHDAEQIVDSITATDIGALPDRSVTEALQRVPGVTMTRTPEPRDADRISV